MHLYLITTPQCIYRRTKYLFYINSILYFLNHKRPQMKTHTNKSKCEFTMLLSNFRWHVCNSRQWWTEDCLVSPVSLPVHSLHSTSDGLCPLCSSPSVVLKVKANNLYHSFIIKQYIYLKNLGFRSYRYASYHQFTR